jgi:hypothetical protein
MYQNDEREKSQFYELYFMGGTNVVVEFKYRNQS